MNKIEKYSIDWKRGRGFFAVYHDSMGITEEPRLRLSYGVLLSGSFTPDRSLGTMQIPENKYIIADFLVGNNDYGRAWTSMFTEIILSKGYEPADGFCFENYFEDCYNGQTGKTRGSIGVPVIKI
ncbi:MAG: effector binding domain-containing protein [Spirochaetales bacterium]|nr:effector binding domain-containing protein [Spirochaetales bacterium]